MISNILFPGHNFNLVSEHLLFVEFYYKDISCTVYSIMRHLQRYPRVFAPVEGRVTNDEADQVEVGSTISTS